MIVSSSQAVLVTGAASGIGAALAVALANCGAYAICADL
ncbi:MAG TPA: 3-hydroxybutyrate dehydrogenase, partial [Gammaproteobacteria bacterium]|nr:3-hydroxybutyrate dehydrogenase [Gammaproteobacteria bacterium]